MIKKLVPFLIVLSFVLTSPLEEAFTVEASVPAPVAAAKPVPVKKPAVKKVAKKPVKKVAKKKKEILISNPPLITLDTAPHSARKVAVAKKKVVKKKS